MLSEKFYRKLQRDIYAVGMAYRNVLNHEAGREEVAKSFLADLDTMLEDTRSQMDKHKESKSKVTFD